MDNGTRISPEVEEFLRKARAKEVTACAEMVKANPGLVHSEEAGGFTALHFAAFNGDIPMIEMLLEHKPDLNQTNYDGNTPLTMAAKGKQPGVIRMLVEAGADVNFKTKSGSTSLHFACTMGDMGIVDLLVSLGAKMETAPSECGSPLHWACQSDDVTVAGYLLFKYGMNVNLLDTHGGTPLFVAIHAKKAEIAHFLLQHGANPNVVAKDGSTPLHVAVTHGTIAEVKNLLAFGAKPDVADHEGKTPLQLAQESKHVESIKELSKKQPDAEKRAADASRFKAQGNKVFGEGESHKAMKFYTLAISLQSNQHVFFSNRSACNFNTKNYKAAYFDACRCLQLDPKFVRGYFRKAATLKAMGDAKAALETIAEGLKLDAKNGDLLNLREEINAKK